MSWKEEAFALHEAKIKYKGKWKPYSPEDQRFLALSVGGEVGEMQNLVKKEWRGDLEEQETRAYKVWRLKLAQEMADVRMLLEVLASCFDINLDKACEGKIDVNLARWPYCRPAVERVRARGKKRRR